jgi:hypothetical protein
LAEIVFIKQDIGNSKEFLKRRRIGMFPYLSLFQNGLPVEFPFTMARKVENLLEFLTINTTQTKLQSMETKKQFSNSKANNSLFIVFFNSKWNENAETIAKNYPKTPMYLTNNAELAKEIGIYANHFSFGVFRNFDEGNRFFQFEEGFDFYHFKPIMEKLRWPKIMELTPESLEYVLLHQDNSLIFIPEFGKKNDVETEELNKKGLQEFIKYSSKNEKFKFFKISKMTPEVDDILHSIGKSHTQKPYLLLVSFEIRPYLKYRFEKYITKEEIKKWVEEFDMGRLKESLKSEPIPEVQDDLLMRVVGLNYNKEVIENKEDVMVFLYSMWCQKSKRIIRDLRKIALRAKRWDTKIKWVVFEITRNEVKGLRNMQSYPNLLLYKSNDKKYPVWYDGVFDERKLENFAHLVIKNVRKYPDEEL